MRSKGIILTGGSGFVGSYLLGSEFSEYFVPISLRTSKIENIIWDGIDRVIHLAGISTITKDDPKELFDQINNQLTVLLAKESKSKGVKQFIFLSSAKVYGENSYGKAFSVNDKCNPTDAYGLSKLRAEEALLKLHCNSFKVCIIRSPIIYGPGVKGNMLKLISLVNSKWPLPFGNCDNSRSVLFIENLILAIIAALKGGNSGLLNVADLKPLSTLDLINLISSELNISARNISLPEFIKSILRKLTPNIYDKMFGSMEINVIESLSQLKIQNSISTQCGVKKMIEWYLENH